MTLTVAELDAMAVRALSSRILDGFKLAPRLRSQLDLLIGDYLRGGFSDDYICHAMRSLVDEIPGVRE